MRAVERGEVQPDGSTRRMQSLSPIAEPHRLFNLDIFQYGPDTPIGLYGSTPFLLAHGSSRAAGALWLNAADTYVDLWAEAAQREGGEDARVGVGSHWLSEAGARPCGWECHAPDLLRCAEPASM